MSSGKEIMKIVLPLKVEIAGSWSSWEPQPCKVEVLHLALTSVHSIHSSAQPGRRLSG